MNVEEDSCFDSVKQSAVCDIDSNFKDTFCQNPEDSRLQVTRFYDNVADDSGIGNLGYCTYARPITFSDEIEYLAVCLHLAKLIYS
jgi:hypothetical protein